MYLIDFKYPAVICSLESPRRTEIELFRSTHTSQCIELFLQGNDAEGAHLIYTVIFGESHLIQQGLSCQAVVMPSNTGIKHGVTRVRGAAYDPACYIVGIVNDSLSKL